LHRAHAPKHSTPIILGKPEITFLTSLGKEVAT
jgi:hypothetical protein